MTSAQAAVGGGSTAGTYQGRDRTAPGGTLRRLVRRLRRLPDLFPWTPLGVLVAGLAYGGLRYYAHEQLDLVWLVAGYAVLGLCAFAPLPVALAALGLGLGRRGELPPGAALLETGLESTSGFQVPSLRLVPFVQLSWRIVEPARMHARPQRRGELLREWVVAEERGRYRRLVRRLTLSDPFGLARITLVLHTDRDLRVLPRLGALSRLPSLTAYASGDALPHPLGLQEGDRLELKRYVPGDPARFIHWKVFGRTRKLMVRVPERALSVAQRTSAFLVAGPGDDASAAAARLAIERRLLGAEWSFGTDLSPLGTDREAEALDRVIRSAAVGDAGAAQLGAFLQEEARRGPSSVVLFVPPCPGPWLSRLTGLAQGRRPHVVMAVDGVVDVPRRSLWRRLLSAAPPSRGVAAAQLQEVTRALREAGCQISVLDRQSGRILGDGERGLLAAQRRRRKVAS